MARRKKADSGGSSGSRCSTVVLAAAGFTLYLDFRVRSEFEGRRFALPARIYARPLELHAGLRIAPADVADELREAGYRDGARAKPESGWFCAQRQRARDRAAAVHLLGRAAAGAAHPRVVRGRHGLGGARRAGPGAAAGAPRAARHRRHLPGEQRGPRAGAAGRGAEAPGAGADRDRRPQLLHPQRLRPARHRARRAERVPRRPRAGRQHADAAAGEELLPHARAHHPAQGHRAGDGGAARAALRQGGDPRDLPERDLPRPGPRPRHPRHRPRRPALLRQAGAAPHAGGERAAGRHGARPDVLRPVPPPAARARAAQPGAARDARAGLRHDGAVHARRAPRRSA